MGWPRSSTYNLLQTLTMTRFLQLNEGDRRYRIGMRLWEAAQGFELGRELAQIATPFLEEANAELDETVQLAILDGIENVYIAKVEAHHHLKLISEVGSRLPRMRLGSGKFFWLVCLPRRWTGDSLAARCSSTRLRQSPTCGIFTMNLTLFASVDTQSTPVNTRSGSIASLFQFVIAATGSQRLSARPFRRLGSTRTSNNGWSRLSRSLLHESRRHSGLTMPDREFIGGRTARLVSVSGTSVSARQGVDGTAAYRPSTVPPDTPINCAVM
jgi:hypothetical protein